MSTRTHANASLTCGIDNQIYSPHIYERAIRAQIGDGDNPHAGFRKPPNVIIRVTCTYTLYGMLARAPAACRPDASPTMRKWCRAMNAGRDALELHARPHSPRVH